MIVLTERFRVINGSRTDRLPAKTSEAKVEIVTPDFHPSMAQIEASKDAPAKYIPNVSFSRLVLERYQKTKKYNLYNALAVIWDHKRNEPVFVFGKNENQLLDNLVENFSDILSYAPEARYEIVYLFDDTSKSFQNYISRHKIKHIHSWRDLRAEFYIKNPFEEEMHLNDEAEVSEDWQPTDEDVAQYSDLIIGIKKMFYETPITPDQPKLFILANDDEVITSLKWPEFSTVEQINSYIETEAIDADVVMVLDLRKGFADQMSNSRFNPKLLSNFIGLREDPYDHFQEIKLLKQLNPTVMGPKGPRLIISNP